MKRQIKKVFLTAVALVALGSLTSNAEVSVNDYRSCEDRAFDAVEYYYSSGETYGFTAGALFQFAYNMCIFRNMM